MSKHDFTAAEFAGRLRRTRAAMEAASLDALLAIHPASIHWLTGSDAKSYQEFQCLLVTPGGPLAVLTRRGEVHEFQMDSLAEAVTGYGGSENEDPIAALAAFLPHHRIGGRVGVEVPAFYLHPHYYLGIRELLGDGFTEATGLIPSLKLVKSEAELRYVRQAAALADAAVARFAAALTPGRTELELAGLVYGTLLQSGSGIAASPINLVSGERSAFSHGGPTARVLRAGDFVNIEFGATRSRYTATIGRQFVLGPPTARMEELHAVVRDASDALIAAIRDGVPASVPHLAAKQVIGAAGLEEGRVHLSGYSLGAGFPPSWAEPLHLLADSTVILRAGMVLTVEPPVFLGREGLGARIIDNVVVTDTGAELLSRTTRELVVVG